MHGTPPTGYTTTYLVRPKFVPTPTSELNQCDDVCTPTDEELFGELAAPNSKSDTLTAHQKLINDFLNSGQQSGLWSAEKSTAAQTDPNFEKAFDAMNTWGEDPTGEKSKAALANVFCDNADDYSESTRDIIKAHLLNHATVSGLAKKFFNPAASIVQRPALLASPPPDSLAAPASVATKSEPVIKNEPVSDQEVDKRVRILIQLFEIETINGPLPPHLVSILEGIFGAKSGASVEAQSKARKDFESFIREYQEKGRALKGALSRYPDKIAETMTARSITSTQSVQQQPLDDAGHTVLAKLLKYHYAKGSREDFARDQTAVRAAEIMFAEGTSASTDTQLGLKTYLNAFAVSGSSGSSFVDEVLLRYQTGTQKPLISTTPAQSGQPFDEPAVTYQSVAKLLSTLTKVTTSEEVSPGVAVQTVDAIFGEGSKASPKAKATVSEVLEQYKKAFPAVADCLEKSKYADYLSAKP